MAIKKDLVNWFAEHLMTMDKEEKKEILTYIIDTMGESFFSELDKEEKVEVMSEAVGALVKHSGLEGKEAQMELLVAMTKGMVDRFTSDLEPGDKGELIASMATSTIKSLGPEIRSVLGVAVRELVDASPVLGQGLRRLIEDQSIRALMGDFVKGLLRLMVDVLRTLAVEVWGYIKESGPEIQEFLRATAKKALQALVRIGIEVLRKALEVIGGLMQAGGRTLLETKDWAQKAWESEELSSIRGHIETFIDEKSGAIMMLVEQGIDDIEELAERTKLPRETIRNILLKMWEKGDVKLDIDKVVPKAGKKGKGDDRKGQGPRPGPSPAPG